jgi:uncharacterized protein YlbG (UPF0298 family)
MSSIKPAYRTCCRFLQSSGHRILFLILLMLAGWRSLPASVTDSSGYHHRAFDPDKIEQYRGDPDFQYERDELNMSWWDRFTKWLRDLFSDVDPDMPDMPDAPKVNLGFLDILGRILVILVIVALVAGLAYLIVKGSSSIIRRKPKGTGEDEIEATETEEDIHDLPIEDLLKTAVDERKWRTAVRILYLRSLRSLSENGHIQWQSQKTNYDYLRELQVQEMRTRFADLTRLFEYIWYGEFPVDQSIFQEASESFSAFDKQILKKS